MNNMDNIKEMMLNKIEIGSRAVLWIALAVMSVFCFGVLPSQIAKQENEKDLKIAMLEAGTESLQEKVDELSKPPELPLKLEDFIASEKWKYDTDEVLYTIQNLSGKEGPICLSAALVRKSDGKEITASPKCAHVSAFSETNIKFLFTFDGKIGTTRQDRALFCKDDECFVRISDSVLPKSKQADGKTSFEWAKFYWESL